MTNRAALLTAILGSVVTVATPWLVATPLAQAKSGQVLPLSDQDRSEIQALVAGYGRALGTCAAEDYARLFAEPDGYFASGPRGKVVGHDRLVALVLSEPFCHDNSERRSRNIPPAIDIQASVDGAIGRAALANNAGR